MIIIENTLDFQLHKDSAVAIGKFDGIHKGHQTLLQKVLEQKKYGLQAVVLTFDPSPASFFAGKSIPELTTKEEKRIIFSNLGVDVLVEFPMTKESAATLPTQFVEQYLVKQMHAKYIAAGTDLSFGDKGLGNSELLVALSTQLDYQAEIIDKVCYQGKEISSTMVREAVKEGKMELAESLMGTAFSVTGRIVHGKKLGRKMGMPTINLEPSSDKILPPNGVYYSQVELYDKVYKSISNIGMKPTVSDRQIMGVETYLYDFSQDVYGEEVTVRLFAFKRSEMKFDSVEALKNQIASDIAEGRYYHHE